MRILSAIRDLLNFLREWLWKKQVAPIPEERFNLKAQEVNLKNTYKVIEYKGQRINLSKPQLDAFYQMNRREKRKVLVYWENLERKGHIRFQEINGQLVAVKNKDYETKADIRQSHSDQT